MISYTNSYVTHSKHTLMLVSYPGIVQNYVSGHHKKVSRGLKHC